MIENKEFELFSSPNEYEINQVCAILSENNIPFIKKIDGSGSYMNLYMGQSIQEKRIFVSNIDYDKSIELISSFISSDIDTEIALETDDEIDNNGNNKKYIFMKYALVFLVLGLPILLAIIVIIISLI